VRLNAWAVAAAVGLLLVTGPVVSRASAHASGATVSRAGRPALSVQPGTPIEGERVHFSGKLPTRPDRPLLLQGHTGTGWQSIVRGHSTHHRFDLSLTARRAGTSIHYRVLAPAVTIDGTPLERVITVARRVTPVAQKAELTGPKTVKAGQVLHLSAVFTPARPGRQVRFQMSASDGWAKVATTYEDSSGTAAWDGSAPSTAAGVTYRASAVSWHGAALVRAHRAVDVVPPSWQEPALLSKSYGDLQRVSCVGETFCVAVDMHGNGVTWDGTSWTPPDTIDTHVYLSDVSCTSTTFCATLDAYGHVFTYDGTGWTPAADLASKGIWDSLSCGSVSFCVAVSDLGEAATYDGATWSSPTTVSDGTFVDVSCTADESCMAINLSGDQFNHAYEFADGTWSPTDGWLIRDEYLNSISCATSTFCLALSHDGDVFTYDGSWWTSRYSNPGLVQPSSVSCPTATFCAVSTYSGAVSTWNGTDWSDYTETVGQQSSYGLSCSSSSFCAVLGITSAATYDGSSWTVTDEVDPHQDGMRTISCVDPDFCQAAGADGNVYSWNGSSWSEPVPVDPHGVPTSLSCRDRGLCVLVDDQGWAIDYNGTTWASPEHVDSGPLRAVSCPRATENVALSCLAVGDSGHVLNRMGDGWGGATIDDQALDDISCASPSWCVGVDASGRVVIDKGSVWSAPATLDSDPIHDLHVSCPTQDFCLAVAGRGVAWSYDGSEWTGTADLSMPSEFPERLTEVSCADTTLCMAVGTAGTYTYDGTGWTHTDTGHGDILRDVSCPTPHFCAAVDAYGYARTWQ
jgi:hypothetical protein